MTAESGANGSTLSLLMAWLSPSFPIGGFSYSHGLEWAVEDGTVNNAASLASWIEGVLVHGAGRTDAILIAQAYHAAFDGDLGRLSELAELAVAFQPSRERHLETTAQGTAFLSAVRGAWPADRLPEFAGRVTIDGVAAYPIAFAVTAAAHDVALEAAIPAYLQAFAANLVSAGLRAVPLGQTDGQRTLAALLPVIAATASEALAAPLTDLGGAALRADIASMKHETQYTRLFRS